MKIKFKTRVVLGTLLFLLFVVSCRQEFLKEDSPSHSATHKSKFQVVKLKDIPHVSNFIKMKTGRKDLKIPMAGKSLSYSKGALEFESLETDFILKKEEGEVAYYIFGISNAGDESTIYNFEVKEVGGDIERAELIEYSSATPYEEDYSNLFRFSGTVTAYNEQKQAVAIGIFDEGVNPECPSTYPPGEGGGGGGVGEVPTIPPGWPPDPFNPLPFPNWPGGPGGSDDPPPPPTEGCVPRETEAIAVIAGLTMMTDGCIVWFEGVFTPSTSKIAPHCNDGSGVVILPGNPKDTPCKKIKEQRENEDFKEKIQDLQSKTGLKKETGYIQKWGGDYEYKENASATPESNTLQLPLVETNTYIRGFMHTHVDDFTIDLPDGVTQIRRGIKMFSPADVSYFMDLIQNAQTKGELLNDPYAVMVTSGGNYQIRFTGNQYQIKTFTNEQLKKHGKDFSKFMKDFMKKPKKLELRFLQYISEKMNLKGVSLYRMNSDGTTTEIKLNVEKTDTVETDCLN